MNKLIFPFILMVALFSMAACSEKFNIAAPYKNITVINAFLDRADTAHYIRIQKAFLDQNKSALVMAKQYDSSFYKSINVRIDRISIAATGNVFDTIHLNRVDLRQEGYQKASGVFFTDTNFAYKFKDVLNPNYLYRIVVTNLITGQVDSAIAPIIDDVTPGAFSVDVIDDSGVNHSGMDFSSTSSNQTFDINILYTPLAGFYFEYLNSPVYLAYPIIRFNWVDSSITTAAKTAHSYDFILGNNAMPTNAVTVSTKNLSLYSALASGMGTAPQFTVRLLDRSDIFVYITTLDYYHYQQASLTQGIGLTGNEIEPVYTNVKGPNALGLYTSRGMHTGKITITLATIDSILASPILTNAHIVGTVYHN